MNVFKLICLLKLLYRFRIYAICSDVTGAIPIIFRDRAVRRVTGKTVFEVTLDETQVLSYIGIFILFVNVKKYQYQINCIKL